MSEWVILYRVDRKAGKVQLFEIGALERAKTFKLNSREAMAAHVYTTIVHKNEMGGLCRTKQEAADYYAQRLLHYVWKLEEQVERANEHLAAAQEFSEQFSDRLKIEDSPCA